MPDSERFSSITTTSKISHAMLMAAGLGTRLRPFTDLEPKALLPLMGVPMAQFALDALGHAGVQNVIANFHHHGEKAGAALSRLDAGEMTLQLSDESQQLLGSAGGIRKALPLIGAHPFFLLNADVLCSVNLKELALAHIRARSAFGAKLTLTVFPAGPKGGSYREILFNRDSGQLTGLGVHGDGRPFFVGAAVIEPEALAMVPPEGPSEFVPTILEPAIREGKAAVFQSDGIWHDVGSPELWRNAHLSLIRSLETQWLPLWSERIEEINKRVGPQLWVSQDAPANIRYSNWKAPAYWNPLGDETALKPDSFGPDVVLYGAAPGRVILQQGIGFRGLWSPLT